MKSGFFLLNSQSYRKALLVTEERTYFAKDQRKTLRRKQILRFVNTLCCPPMGVSLRSESLYHAILYVEQQVKRGLCFHRNLVKIFVLNFNGRKKQKKEGSIYDYLDSKLSERITLPPSCSRFRSHFPATDSELKGIPTK